ncbi:efflux RND transporter periplasmic adaptor subunit [Roseomonas haemaphysalidis]|uniref:Efflux RND transporter periplasmic adaptor subunit n=1 Tax=Roseomonas haemaphysalidis TaxID=2768162 RepID=A0ABS3KQ68_9PROT|nr:efflux RND transporter periplasmic adaptor subunit [Roseomonas haemaphysalidis]MBO1078501.1 efflux RND transporter periplasmic adaptor subunit [Roseomonas haemaphysalidis]
MVLVLAGGAGWWLWPRTAPVSVPVTTSASPLPSLSVTVVPVQARPLARVVFGDGSVVPWQELVIGAETGGLRVSAVLVEEGDAVRAGQVLLQLDASVATAQRDGAAAGLQEAEAALAIARSDLGRATQLSTSGSASRQLVDQRQAAARQAEARLASARAALAEAEARLAQATIRAPFAGIVLRRNVLAGAVPGLGTELVRLLRDGRLELDARVPELELSAVAPGQAVRVTHGGREIAATVRAVAPNVTAESRLGVVHVALPPDSGLRPGMFARAEIHGDAAPALVVPQEAVVFRDGAAAAFVVEDGQARLRRLDTGARQDGEVEVRAGLAAGEAVVRSGAGFLADGDRVRVVPAVGG